MNVTGMKRIVACAIGAALMVSVAACGTTDDGGAAKSSGSSTASAKGFDASGIHKDAAIAALLPSSVTKDGKLTVGSDTSYAPAEFLAPDGKTPVGFSVDLTKALAAVVGLRPETVSSTFDGIIPSVGTKYDIGISSFTVNQERLAAVDFVTYFKAGSTFVVKKGNPEKIDPAKLCGKKLAVQTGTTQETAAADLTKACKAQGDEEIHIQSLKLQTDVTTAVASGKADVFYADTPVAGYAIKQTGDILQTIGEDQDVAPEGIVIKKGDSGTAQAMQKAMQKLIDDGTYGKILKTWGVADGAIKTAEINPAV
ncbi:ABC transporter substrate-binding protein [Bifidobacterium mongoliense]|uniref:ABC transporter substrate-binding protein n=1 Tax=Bifidobacterium mongoliense TaxID=518643 RepID=UPI0030EEDB10